MAKSKSKRLRVQKQTVKITIEGPIGSGKTTLAHFIGRYLMKQGCMHVDIRDQLGDLEVTKKPFRALANIFRWIEVEIETVCLDKNGKVLR